MSAWSNVGIHLHRLQPSGAACQGWYGDYAEGGCCPVERSRSSRLWLDGQERDFELCGSDQQGSV